MQVSYLGYLKQSKNVYYDGSETILDFILKIDPVLSEEVVVTATRAGEKAPITYSEMSREEIEELNFGQDIPFILQYEPSMVVTSDAGAGVARPHQGGRLRDAARLLAHASQSDLVVSRPSREADSSNSILTIMYILADGIGGPTS